MRYLRKFSENFNTTELLYNDTWFRIEDNVKDIFVEYQDSNDLDVVVGKGHLPNQMTVAGLDDDVIEVKLFAQRGIRFGEISGEIGMLIEYMKSLTDKEVKIYYDLDRSGLRNWRPLAGSDNEFDYYLQRKSSMSFNTIRIYFVESVGKVTESLDIDDKVIEDITDMFVELKDAGINYLVSKEDPYLTVKGQDGIGIILHKNRNDATIDLELVRDCVEMTKDYLSGLFDFTEFYRFGFVWSTSPDSPKGSRSSLECNSFPDDLTKDIRKDLFVSSYQGGFYYELEGIKIVFIQK